jgi:hypothetical protein
MTHEETPIMLTIQETLYRIARLALGMNYLTDERLKLTYSLPFWERVCLHKPAAGQVGEGNDGLFFLYSLSLWERVG